MKTGSLKALACLIASCVKEDGKAVGLDFAYQIDLMNGLPYFMEYLTELIDNSLPKEEDESKQKKTKVKKI